MALLNTIQKPTFGPKSKYTSVTPLQNQIAKISGVFVSETEPREAGQEPGLKISVTFQFGETFREFDEKAGQEVDKCNAVSKVYFVPNKHSYKLKPLYLAIGMDENTFDTEDAYFTGYNHKQSLLVDRWLMINTTPSTDQNGNPKVNDFGQQFQQVNDEFFTNEEMRATNAQLNAEYFAELAKDKATQAMPQVAPQGMPQVAPVMPNVAPVYPQAPVQPMVNPLNIDHVAPKVGN